MFHSYLVLVRLLYDTQQSCYPCSVLYSIYWSVWGLAGMFVRVYSQASGVLSFRGQWSFRSETVLPLLDLPAGTVLIKAGFTAIMPWAAPSMSALPELKVGEKLPLKDIELRPVLFFHEWTLAVIEVASACSPL